MQDKVGLAIVGCGYWGSKHVRIVHQSPMLDVTLAVDARQESLDYASVQRGNPEMERRAQEVIDTCMALGDANPIAAIHDLGAGGGIQRRVADTNAFENVSTNNVATPSPIPLTNVVVTARSGHSPSN